MTGGYRERMYENSDCHSRASPCHTVCPVREGTEWLRGLVGGGYFTLPCRPWRGDPQRPQRICAVHGRSSWTVTEMVSLGSSHTLCDTV